LDNNKAELLSRLAEEMEAEESGQNFRITIADEVYFLEPDTPDLYLSPDFQPEKPLQLVIRDLGSVVSASISTNNPKGGDVYCFTNYSVTDQEANQALMLMAANTDQTTLGIGFIDAFSLIEQETGINVNDRDFIEY